MSLTIGRKKACEILANQTYNNVIDNILNHIIENEETWQITNNVTDSGGFTVAGLALKFQSPRDQMLLRNIAENHFVVISGKRFVKEDVNVRAAIINIYRNNYVPDWLRYVPIVSLPILISFGINAGVVNALKIVQRSVAGPDLKADGVFGPVTAKALMEQDKQTFCANLPIMILSYYARLCQNKPSELVNLAGWMKRVSQYLTVDPEQSIENMINDASTQFRVDYAGEQEMHEYEMPVEVYKD